MEWRRLFLVAVGPAHTQTPRRRNSIKTTDRVASRVSCGVHLPEQIVVLGQGIRTWSQGRDEGLKIEVDRI